MKRAPKLPPKLTSKELDDRVIRFSERLWSEKRREASMKSTPNPGAHVHLTPDDLKYLLDLMESEEANPDGIGVKQLKLYEKLQKAAGINQGDGC